LPLAVGARLAGFSKPRASLWANESRAGTFQQSSIRPAIHAKQVNRALAACPPGAIAPLGQFSAS
jgi:hypothetical protein